MRAEQDKVVRLLKTARGQLDGLLRMVEEDRYCIDILTQLQAVRAALARLESEVLKDHMDHCVMGAIAGDDLADRKAKATELIELLGRASR